MKLADHVSAAARGSDKYGAAFLVQLAVGLFTGGAAALTAVQKYRSHAQKAARGVQELKDFGNGSLTAAMRKMIIPSRAYIDSALATSPITGDILNVAHSLYASMILGVLNLENFVSDSVTLSDRLSSVSTVGMEAYRDSADLIRDALALEALKTQQEMLDFIGTQARHNAQRVVDENVKAIKEATGGKKNAGGKAVGLSPSDVTQPAPEVFPIGRTISATFVNPTDPSVTQTANLMVQIYPYVLSQRAIEAVIDNSAPPSFYHRFLQCRAGEKAFIKDLIFQVDRIKKMEAAHREDTDGGFGKYMQDISRHDKFRLRNLLSAGGGRAVSKNASSNILIISQDTLDMIKADTGVDLTDKGTRDRYLREAYTMMIFVVNEAYGKVRLYMSGIDDVGEYTTDQFSGKARKGDSDLSKMLAFITQGRPPRF